MNSRALKMAKLIGCQKKESWSRNFLILLRLYFSKKELEKFFQKKDSSKKIKGFLGEKSF